MSGKYSAGPRQKRPRLTSCKVKAKSLAEVDQELCMEWKYAVHSWKKQTKERSIRSDPKRDHKGNIIAKFVPKKTKKKSEQAGKKKLESRIVLESPELPEEELSRNISEIEQQMIDLLRTLEQMQQDIQPKEKKSKDDWATRRHKEEGSWEQVRQDLVHHLLMSSVPEYHKCIICHDSRANIRCNQCVGKYLCAECDWQFHLFKPLHDRSVLLDNYLQALEPCQVLDQEYNIVYRACFVPVLENLPSAICDCGTDTSPESHGKCILVTLKGRHDVFLPKNVCRECPNVLYPKIKDVITAGYWPGSPEVVSGMYIFSQDVIQFFDLLKKEKPSMSVRGFLSTLELISSKFSRHNVISPKVFTAALKEWRECQYKIREWSGEDLFGCPTCGKNPHAVDIDGNKKIYRYKRRNVYEEEETYAGGKFICEDGKVNAFVNRIKNSKIKNSSNTCGQNHFQAARDSGKSFGNLDETGLCMACCRHCIILRGLNMYQGEIFAYPLYLLVDLIHQGYSMKFLAQDVVCKFYPWLQKIVDANQDDPKLQQLKDLKPFLAVMHAKAHSWSCQMRWGGRMQAEAGYMSGEEMELCNAYLSLAGHTTKTMSKQAREIELTELVMHWNGKKISKMTYILSVKYEKCLKAMSENDVAQQQIHYEEETVEGWKESLTLLAAEHQNKRHMPLYELTDSEKIFALADIHTAVGQKLQAHSCLKAITNLPNSKKVVTKRQILERFQEDEADIVDQGQVLVADRVCEILRREIEILDTAIRKHQTNISRVADRCKRRAAIRKKMSEDKSAMKSKCADYNSIVQLVDPGAAAQIDPTVLEDIDRVWPWIANYQDGQLSLREKQHIVSLVEIRKRLQEEKKLLLHEMECYLKTLQKEVKQNEKMIEEYLPTGYPGDNTLGIKAVKAAHTELLRARLSNALLVFRKCTQEDFNLEISQNEDPAFIIEDFQLFELDDLDDEELFYLENEDI